MTWMIKPIMAMVRTKRRPTTEKATIKRRINNS
jgi:hypothetical protein